MKLLRVPDDLVSVVRNALRARAKDMAASDAEKAERVRQLAKQLESVDALMKRIDAVTMRRF